MQTDINLPGFLQLLNAVIKFVFIVKKENVGKKVHCEAEDEPQQ